MDKKVGGALLALLAVATLVYMVVGLNSGPDTAKKGGEASGKPSAASSEAAAKAAPQVGKEDLRGAAPAADAGDLKLPGALPTLQGVQVAAATDTPKPALPHGQLQLEGDVQEAEAEQAIAAMWPAIRTCYVELRQRAPQARGRMLMTFQVKPGEGDQAATGELFLKETQFTDPKYLTCVRAAIDSARFPVSRKVTGSVTVPLFLSPQDAGEAAPVPAAAPR